MTDPALPARIAFAKTAEGRSAAHAHICQDCVPCLRRDLLAIAKARDALVGIARLLADGDFTPSAVCVRGEIERLSKAGKR